MKKDLPISETAPVLASIKDAGTILGGLGRDTIYRLLEQGKLDAVALGGRTMITMESLNRLPQRLKPWSDVKEARRETHRHERRFVKGGKKAAQQSSNAA